MSKIRRCDSRCHTAKGSRCKCWCGGHFHGKAGAINREAIAALMDPLKQRTFLKAHGFKENQTAYIEQKQLPI